MFCVTGTAHCSISTDTSITCLASNTCVVMIRSSELWIACYGPFIVQFLDSENRKPDVYIILVRWFQITNHRINSFLLGTKKCGSNPRISYSAAQLIYKKLVQRSQHPLLGQCRWGTKGFDQINAIYVIIIIIIIISIIP